MTSQLLRTLKRSWRVGILWLLLPVLLVISLYLDTATTIVPVLPVPLPFPFSINTFLSTLAQIIAFALSLMVTGVVVIRQYLGDRLPQLVIGAFALSKTVLTFLALLLELLLSSLVVLYVSDTSFTPYWSVLLVLLVLLTTLAVVPLAFYFVATAISRMSVNNMLRQLANDCTVEPQKLLPLETVHRNLLLLSSSVSFLVAHDYNELAGFSFRLFLTSCEHWTEDIQAHYRVTDAAAADLTRKIARAYGSLPATLLRSCIERNNASAFSRLARLLALRLDSLPVDFRRTFATTLKELSSEEHAGWSTQFTNGLLAAADIITHHAVHRVDKDLFNAGVSMLGALDSHIGEDTNVISIAILGNLPRTLTCILADYKDANDAKVRSSLAEMWKTLSGLFSHIGTMAVRTGSSQCMASWLGAAEHVLQRAVDDGSSFVHDFVSDLLDVYDLGLYFDRTVVYSHVPRMLPIFMDDAAAYPLLAASAPKLSHGLYISLNARNDEALLALVGAFSHIYDKALEHHDADGVKAALSALSQVPVGASITGNNLGAFYGKAMREAANITSVKQLLQSLEDLTSRADGPDIGPFYYIMGELRKLLARDVVDVETRASFLNRFTADVPGDPQLRAAKFTWLVDVVGEAQSVDVLLAFFEGVWPIALKAIEEQDEDLLLECSNAIGLTLTNFIHIDIGLQSKQTALEEGVKREAAIMQSARTYALSEHCIVSLSTFWSQVGTNVQTLNVMEREVLRPIVLTTINALSISGRVIQACHLALLLTDDSHALQEFIDVLMGES